MLKYNIISIIGLIFFFIALGLALGLGISVDRNPISYHVVLKFIGIAILFCCSFGSVYYSEIKKMEIEKNAIDNNRA